MKIHNRLALLTIVTTLTSCGQFSFFNQHPIETHRQIASAAVEQMVEGSEQAFDEELNEQLKILHQYYIIGHKHMADFDELLKTKELEEVYESQTYRSLIVTRELIEEIEDSILDAQEGLSESLESEVSNSEKMVPLKKITSLFAKARLFSESGPTQKASMENLITRLSHSFKMSPLPKSQHLALVMETLKAKKEAESPINKDIEKKFKAEFKSLTSVPEFEIQQKNIDHLSLILDIETTPKAAKYYPSAGKAGNITGAEFPAKVWSLTFNDGPGKDSTMLILNNLKKRNMKASFFQIADQVKANPQTADEIKTAGMEIASHSYSHLQLTKLGPLGLEKQISTATKEIEKFYDIDVKYFRLPYGVGVNNAAIRNKIADNKLIHVFWTIDTLDWISQTPDKIVTRTLTMMKKSPKDAGIILMHDIHQRTAIASAQIMDYLQKDNRRTCVLDEIIRQINEGAIEVCPPKE